MDTVLEGISHVICLIIDDILVTGTSDANHLQNLATVLERLKKTWTVPQKRKMFHLFEYLCHKIDVKDLHALPRRLEL